MFGSDIIEVAIGMAFLYLFMSMIASALREVVEAWMKKRATDLERGIQEMLRTDPQAGSDFSPGLLDMLRSMLPLWLIGQKATDLPPFETWAKRLYEHPLVSSLFRGTYDQARATGNLPSYIPKENFALAILDLVADASATGNRLSITTLQSTLANVPQPNAVQRVVLTALSTAAGDIDKVKTSLEAWYDGTMDRVSGWYARHTAAILFVLGIGAAVALNVDSITVAKRLLTDRSLRQAIVTRAENFAKTQPDPTKSQSFDKLRTELGEVGYPIGWAKVADTYYPGPQTCVARPDPKDPQTPTLTCKTPNAIQIFSLLMGWLITAIAIMLGAPFWFDMLNKLISIRSALKPPEAPKKPGTP